MHDYIKFIKHGYGKVLDHACREIRLRRMTRREGIKLSQDYQSREPQHLQLLLDWLGITKNAFHYIVDQHRNQRFFGSGMKIGTGICVMIFTEIW